MQGHSQSDSRLVANLCRFENRQITVGHRVLHLCGVNQHEANVSLCCRPSYEVEMTYTEEEMKARQLHRDWYLQWMRGTAAQLLAEVAEPSKPLYDISCSRLYLMTGAVGKRDDAAAAPQSRLKDAMPRDVMVPLTMLQLYNIKIDPLCISFGMVRTHLTTSCRTVTRFVLVNPPVAYLEFGLGGVR